MIVTGNVIPALIVLTAVVFVHEMGHFLVARWCGIRVAAFSIGFGRELAGFTDRRGTRWKLSRHSARRLCALRGRRERREHSRSGGAGGDAAVRARRASSISRRCGSASPSSRPGPLANFLLAILVFAAVFTLIGRPHVLPVAETVVAGSAAERAGIKPGDRIVSVDGNTIEFVLRAAEHRHALGRRDA